jgi:hypothetical protein
VAGAAPSPAPFDDAEHPWPSSDPFAESHGAVSSGAAGRAAAPSVDFGELFDGTAALGEDGTAAEAVVALEVAATPAVAVTADDFASFDQHWDDGAAASYPGLGDGAAPAETIERDSAAANPFGDAVSEPEPAASAAIGYAPGGAEVAVWGPDEAISASIAEPDKQGGVSIPAPASPGSAADTGGAGATLSSDPFSMWGADSPALPVPVDDAPVVPGGEPTPPAVALAPTAVGVDEESTTGAVFDAFGTDPFAAEAPAAAGDGGSPRALPAAASPEPPAWADDFTAVAEPAGSGVFAATSVTPAQLDASGFDGFHADAFSEGAAVPASHGAGSVFDGSGGVGSPGSPVFEADVSNAFDGGWAMGAATVASAEAAEAGACESKGGASEFGVEWQ